MKYLARWIANVDQQANIAFPLQVVYSTIRCCLSEGCVSPVLWATHLAIVWLALSSCGLSQVFNERFDDWPTNLKINGKILIVGELENVQLFKKFIDRDDLASGCLVICDATDEQRLTSSLRAVFPQLTTCTTDQLSSVPAESIPAQIAWFGPASDGSDQAQEFLSFQLQRGKTILSAGRAALDLGRYYIENVSARGMNLLPDCILELQFDTSTRHKLLSSIAAHPRSVGIGLFANSALALQGRKLTVVGPSEGHSGATLMLMADERQPLRIETIVPKRSNRQSASEWTADLTEWRRDAIDRTLEPFPEQSIQRPHLESGALIIVGGGGMPAGLMDRFVELAGGSDTAQLVYIPCSEEDHVAEHQPILEQWKKMGVQVAGLLHTKDRQVANADASFLEPLRHATGIWFGGGRQWNLADSYYGTEAHRLMKQVLLRGGVIGGSSAGASIQARYLARATPVENLRIMAPGYERGGLGFLSGVAIDQHFTQRGRQPDMTQLVNRYPQLLGIGIDEATAIEVQGSIATVIGSGSVFFYDRQQPVFPFQPDYLKLSAGQSYDLGKREKLDAIQKF